MLYGSKFVDVDWEYFSEYFCSRCDHVTFENSIGITTCPSDFDMFDKNCCHRFEIDDLKKQAEALDKAFIEACDL